MFFFPRDSEGYHYIEFYAFGLVKRVYVVSEAMSGVGEVSICFGCRFSPMPSLSTGGVYLVN